MKRTILAILATLGLILGGAQMASAHSIFPVTNTWNPNQPVITVSDRSGFDLNEYEAAYAWGSYSADSISMAYTQQQTCTWCIRIVNEPASFFDIPNRPAVSGKHLTYGGASVGYYTDQCTIYVNEDYFPTHTQAAYRQAIITHELGHCLGFDHTYSTTVDTCSSIMAGQGWYYPITCYKPTSSDYYELGYHY